MNIMIIRIVAEKYLQRVQRQAISAMVVDRLEGGEREKHDSLSYRHQGDEVCETRAERVEN